VLLKDHEIAKVLLTTVVVLPAARRKAGMGVEKAGDPVFRGATH